MQIFSNIFALIFIILHCKNFVRFTYKIESYDEIYYIRKGVN